MNVTASWIFVVLVTGALGSFAGENVVSFPEGFTPTQQPIGRLLVASGGTFKRVGEGSFIQCRDGQLLLFFDARRSTGDLDPSCIRVISSSDGGKTWDAGRTILVDADASMLQPSLCRLGNGKMGMTYSRLLKDKIHAGKYFVTSNDEGSTWSRPVPVSQAEQAYMTGAHDRLVVLRNGRLLSLVHGKMRQKKPFHLTSRVYTSDDHGARWTSRTPDGLDVDQKPFPESGEFGLWETSVVECQDGQLLLYGRTATGYLWQSRSRDGGTTWSVPEKTTVPNPLAPVRLTCIPGTNTLLMFCNPRVDMKSGWHGGARNVLAVRVSVDAGRTWSACRQVEFTTASDQWYDYPFVLWVDDVLHLGYRAPNAKTFACSIYYQAFEKDALLQLAGRR